MITASMMRYACLFPETAGKGMPGTADRCMIVDMRTAFSRIDCTDTKCLPSTFKHDKMGDGGDDRLFRPVTILPFIRAPRKRMDPARIFLINDNWRSEINISSPSSILTTKTLPSALLYIAYDQIPVWYHMVCPDLYLLYQRT